MWSPAFVVLLVFLNLSCVLPSSLYWEEKFPNVPVPSYLKELLKPNVYHYPQLSRELNFLMLSGPKLKYDKRCCKKSTIQYKPNSHHTTYYLLNDLPPGRKITIYFGNGGSSSSKFLPREVVNKIPFSSNKVPEILNYYKIKPNSLDHSIVLDTLTDCELPPMSGEEKVCATSLESMIDFGISKLGKEISMLATPPSSEHLFTVSKEAKLLAKDGIACHKLRYMYAIYHCHKIEGTQTFSVPLIGANGSHVEAISICHTNTTHWNPHHFFFKDLKAKPGGATVCHFLAKDTLVWVGKNM